jgi:hypothetical protein
MVSCDDDFPPEPDVLRAVAAVTGQVRWRFRPVPLPAGLADPARQQEGIGVPDSARREPVAVSGP